MTEAENTRSMLRYRGTPTHHTPWYVAVYNTGTHKDECIEINDLPPHMRMLETA